MNKSKHVREIAVLGLVSLLSCLGFLFFSLETAGPGFPLDDAWIHQAFARNFADSGRWGFQVGQPSGGSTGPLWGLLLALNHLVGLPEVMGAFLLGFLLLWACAVSGFHLGRLAFPDSKAFPLVLGLVLALEWHLVWAALSGMETLLLIWLITLVFRWILAERKDWWLPGLLVGVSIWVRPDGITLLGPLLLTLVMSRDKNPAQLKSGALLLGFFLLSAGPYFIFNHFVAGEFWPSTFYAKQAEYAVLREVGIFKRLAQVSLQLVTGVGILLVPGLLLELGRIYRERDWGKVGIFIWAAGYLAIYAARLPVVYQHGRYIMPVIPALMLLGAAGLWGWVDLAAGKTWKRVISAVWCGAAAVVLAAFWVNGAKAYALDVGVIETEMVDVAHWIREYTPEGAVIGAHDIGGLGYFSGREVIDLAGLIRPDVIPFIRDQGQLGAYLDAQGAEYLVTFPSWYPELVQDLTMVHQGSGTFSALFGMDRMAVYLWK